MNVLISSTKKGETRKNVGGLLSRLEYHFIPEEYIYEENINKDGYISNHYIANKFNFYFLMYLVVMILLLILIKWVIANNYLL